MRLTLWLFAAALAVGEPAVPTTLDLPAAQKTGGMPLMDALAKRATARAFDPRDLSTQQLSNVLWAAFGINRPDGKRTAPSAMNRQETDIYVLLKQGVYVYDAKGHRLTQVLTEDVRSLDSRQDFVKEAPLTLVFVADLARMGSGPAQEKESTAAIDAGFISQNVYLYCASEGLATGVRGWVDRDALGKGLGLRPDQKIIAAQSVGYPKKP
jgi:SagB-type dehydrogenase family enzyme